MVRVAMQRLECPLVAVGAFMILQCHDEIVVECPVDAVDAVVALTCEQMTAFDFWLRPRVECERGETYGDMTKIREAIPSPRLSDSGTPAVPNHLRQDQSCLAGVVTVAGAKG